MQRKVAVIVIHGIGEQEPFETLDAFVRPFSTLYGKIYAKKKQGPAIRQKHLLTRFPDWIESFVSIDPGYAGKPIVDIFEYYWAYMAQREITASEVVEWGLNVVKGAKEFYKRHKSAGKTEKNDALFTKDGEFQYIRYVINLLGFSNILRRIGWYISRKFLWCKPIFVIMKRFSEKLLVETLGDVALYTATDKKSAYFDIRKKILSGAVQKLTFMLKEKEYTDIILLGHSLGSVIAYDALDRINKEMNIDESLRKQAPKIKGLVTFGSPLDKIAFFFDEKINKEKQNIRYAITSQLHGFKRANVDRLTLEDGITQYLEHVKWLNFWTKPDPVSGHLDVYRDVDNIEMDFSDKIKHFKWLSSRFSITSHSLYWQSEKFYQKLIETFQL